VQGVEAIGRSLARLRDLRWDIYAQPMRETRLEMQIVFFPLRMPFGTGVTLNVPLLTIIKPMSSVPSQGSGAHSAVGDGARAADGS
jgi:hypothetical protein